MWLRLFILILIARSTVAHGSLSSKLRRFDIAYVERRPVKRDASSVFPLKRVEIVDLHAFDRKFRFSVRPSEGLLDPNFMAYTDDERTQKVLPIDTEDFLSGYVEGYENSDVRLTYETGDSLLGQADIGDGDLIMFEPAWRHDPSYYHENATLVYRVSDIITDESTRNSSFCGYIDLGVGSTPNPALLHPFIPYVKGGKHHQRVKRQFGSDTFGGGDDGSDANQLITPQYNRCPLKLVVDHRFYNDIAGKRDASAVKYIINLMDRVNAIYTTTNFNGFINMGFMVKEIVIKTEASNQHGHWNAPNPASGLYWNVEELLKVFTEYEGSNSFCLVHLFTSQSFQGGVLGLGYIAGPRFSDRGGICSPASSSVVGANSQRIFYNTALSTMRSTVGDAVITREADIVTAHELGHNWGSAHDRDKPECSPSPSKGGAFIMHTFSVSGYDPNNKKFSPCSIDAIKPVLDSKHELCFQLNPSERWNNVTMNGFDMPQGRYMYQNKMSPWACSASVKSDTFRRLHAQRSSYCGNQRVEEDEQCDAGILTDNQTADKCCDRLCRLKFGAQCSPKNSLCCTDGCSFAPSGTECARAGQCYRSATCSGDSGQCPEPRPKPDGTPCIDNGKCINGTCVPYCETLDMKPCMCEEKQNECVRCCRDNFLGAQCKPVTSVSMQLPTGTPCLRGLCDSKGVCQKEAADFVSLLWKIAERYDRNGFWRLIEDNLVLCVIIVTLVFWIPASILVCHCDAERERQLKDTYQWDTTDYRPTPMISQYGMKRSQKYQSSAVDSRVSQVNHL